MTIFFLRREDPKSFTVAFMGGEVVIGAMFLLYIYIFMFLCTFVKIFYKITLGITARFFFLVLIISGVCDLDVGLEILVVVAGY